MNENTHINEANMEKLILTVVTKTISSLKESFGDSEWMSLKEAAKYANVSYNTLMKFRVMGLKISEIDGVKRVSKKEVDRFLEEHSF
ncbi:helix-turn-helix domain-containing protein [Solibacillus silvestris]|uniref:helix-turn-helix domain-containing protein n=1 Tax=Solibacillus silvestris TaxID=76853 RepID=UPI003F820470